MKDLICFLCVLLSLSLSAQDSETLAAPESNDEVICGAGFVTLLATSDVNDSALQFEWFGSSGGQLQFLGVLDGSTGRSQFITPFLIADQSFAVRVRLGNAVSAFTVVDAVVQNEATIVQQPEIQLCGEAYLEVSTNMDSIEMYQWQILVPDEFGQSFFQNLTTESSDSVILIAEEAGFYRAIVTDSTGCRAISSEVEVSSDPVVEFINSVIHCYDPDMPSSTEVTLTSNYGRDFTEYEWEESLDSVNFISIGNAQSIDVSKPTLLDFDTAYYRLTITEQNCSNDTTIAVYWRPVPEGTIKHLDPLIDEDDFFFCDEDAEAARTLRFESTSPNIVVNWFSVNYSQAFALAALKSFSGETGAEDYFAAKEMLGIQIAENFLGEGTEIVLEQKDGVPSQVDGGLIFAIVEDTISECGGVTNGIFADTAFPFPMHGVNLAYEYEPGLDFIPACVGESLVFTSFDQTADAYVWLEYDEVADTYTPVDNDAVFDLTVDASFTGGTYFLEVTKNGCTGLSQGFDVMVADLPSVEITNVDDQVVACNEIPSVLLVGEGSADVVSYQWYYSPDDVNYVPALGDSTKHFYSATINGYYKLEAFNAFCSAETASVFVEIPVTGGVELVEVILEGERNYCEGEEILITCDYESANASYFWYYSFFQLDEDDPSIELVELGETSDPQITLDSRVFGSSITEPMVLYFYIIVVDQDCIVGTTATVPFTVTINPSPNIEILFENASMMNEVFVCGDGTISEVVEVNNLASVDIPNLSYLWTQYNPEIDDYDTIAGAISTQFTITEPGRYRSIASTSDNTCSSISNSLDVLKLPTGISGDELFCLGNDITIQAEQPFAPDLSIYTYQWYHSPDGNGFTRIDGATDFQLIIDSENALYGSGSFYYVANYDVCLSLSDTIVVNENVNSFNSLLSVDQRQEKGIPFEAAVSLGDNVEGVTFSWEPSEFISFSDGGRAIFNVPEAYASDSLRIQLTIAAENGCVVVHDQWIVFEEMEGLTFSRFVSPNGDGLNDVFKISGLNTQIPNQLNVLDSWGNELFSYANYYNEAAESDALVGSLKAEGVYFYVFSMEGSVVKGSFYFKN